MPSRRNIALPVSVLARRYASGESVFSLARAYRVTFGVIRKRLLDAGVTLRTNSQQCALTRSKPTERAKMERYLWSKMRGGVHIDRAQIEHLYLNDMLSPGEIGRRLGCTGKTIYRWLAKWGISLRGISAQQRIRLSRSESRDVMQKKVWSKTSTRFSGAKNPRWAGERRIEARGYVLVRVPGHPYADQTGWVREHRIVMEQHLGRYLEEDEIVHHINEDKLDNRIENLQVVSKAEHARIHQQLRNAA